MNFKSIPIVIAALFLLGTASGYAATQWGEYKGFSKTQVKVNQEVVSFKDKETPSIVVHGTPMVPASLLSDELQAVVEWDQEDMTLSIYKPNVHMFIAKSVTGKEGKEGIDYSIRAPFGMVEQGDKFDFFVFIQVDQLKSKLTSFKISIEDPHGKDAVKPYIEEKLASYALESFWFPAPFNVSFDEVGEYKVKFSIKTEADSDFVTISEKTIVSDLSQKK